MEEEESVTLHREVSPRNNKYRVSLGLLRRHIANAAISAGCLHDYEQQEAEMSFDVSSWRTHLDERNPAETSN